MGIFDDAFETDREVNLRDDSEMVSFTGVKILQERDKSYLIRFADNPKPQWVAKKLTHLVSEDEIQVTQWLLDKWAEEGFDPTKPNAKDQVTVPGCLVLRETDAAIQVQLPKDSPVQGRIWIPKGQILPDSQVKEDGDLGDLVITRWIASGKGLVSDEEGESED